MLLSAFGFAAWGNSAWAGTGETPMVGASPDRLVTYRGGSRLIVSQFTGESSLAAYAGGSRLLVDGGS